MDIVALDNQVKVSIDQVLVTQFVDPDRTYTRGRISLYHPGDGTIVEFRKIEIKQLEAP